MDRTRLNTRARCSGSTPSEESALDFERNCCGHPTLQPFASAGQHCESNAAYFSWPTSSRLSDAAEERANYFANLRKGVLPETLGQLPKGQQANTLLELMTIRAFHSKILRCYSLGTAIGFHIKHGVLTDIPAILVFVSRKVHKKWLSPIQCLPSALDGPGGVWCDVDVVEFSYFGVPEATPKEQLYTKIVDDLRGGDPSIGSGSQQKSSTRPSGIVDNYTRTSASYNKVASQETYGTLGAIVKGQIGSRQVGFLTNRHVAVDLDYPNQKMFHPLPPTLGPGVYLGAVERATSFSTDDLWYGIFTGINAETFVRADGAFIPFADDFDTSAGIGEIGDVKIIDLQSPTSSLIGKQVMKVGRSSGLTAVAVQEQRAASATAIGSTVGDSSPPDGMLLEDKAEEKIDALDLQIQHIPFEVEHRSPETNPSIRETEFHLEDGVKACPSVEHQFIPSFTRNSPLCQNNPSDKVSSENLASLRNGCDEDICFSLQLGDNETKRRRSDASTSKEESK